MITKFLIIGLLALTLFGCSTRIDDFELIDLIEQCNEHGNLRMVWSDAGHPRAQCHDGTHIEFRSK